MVSILTLVREKKAASQAEKNADIIIKTIRNENLKSKGVSIIMNFKSNNCMGGLRDC
ncbi:MAG: hypothetical protein AABZ28_05015 [Nitrospinota bacterium]